METSLTSSDERTERTEWKLSNGLVVPCYKCQDIIDMGESFVPHERFSMQFPFDTTVRGNLLTFAVMCRNFGYYGLDQEGYGVLGEFLRDKSDLGMWIGTIPLDKLTKQYKTDLPFLVAQNVDGREVYFPTGYYILGNK